MGRAVIDASALLALINDEPGADVVRDALSDAVVSTVDLAQVVSFLRDGGIESDAVRSIILNFGLAAAPFDEGMAFEAGEMRPGTRHSGLSLGERACPALAKREGAPVPTSDRTWSKLDVGVDVRAIR